MTTTVYQIPRFQVSLVKESTYATEVRRIRTSADVRNVLAPIFEGADRELFVVAMLDVKHAVNGVNVVSFGSLTQSIVHPREVFKPAILANAVAVVVAHNHPSGDPEPSPEDRALTERLAQAGALLGIQLLDHVVLGDDGRYVSFADRGWLKTEVGEL